MKKRAPETGAFLAESLTVNIPVGDVVCESFKELVDALSLLVDARHHLEVQSGHG